MTGKKTVKIEIVFPDSLSFKERDTVIRELLQELDVEITTSSGAEPFDCEFETHKGECDLYYSGWNTDPLKNLYNRLQLVEMN